MYLHLGQEVVVRFKEIIGVFDLENTTGAAHTRRFLAEAEKKGRVVNVSPELPRSFVITRDRDGNETVYISQLSTATLLRRSTAWEGGVLPG